MSAFTGSPFRGLAAAVVVAALSAPGPAAVVKPRAVAPHPRAANRHPHHHLHHLQQAAQDLKAAEAAAAAGNAARTSQLLTAAHGQIEQAISHHRQHHLTAPRSGLGGLVQTARHHRHHGHLHAALAAIKAAHKQVAAGNTTGTVKDIEKAEHQVQLAIASHHRLIGR